MTMRITVSEPHFIKAKAGGQWDSIRCPGGIRKITIRITVSEPHFIKARAGGQWDSIRCPGGVRKLPVG